MFTSFRYLGFREKLNDCLWNKGTKMFFKQAAMNVFDQRFFAKRDRGKMFCHLTTIPLFAF